MYVKDNISIKIPEAAEEILKTLKDAGYEAYIVGGCVRDSILGRLPEDWDITTEALPEQVKSLFKSTVDTGIEHGTVMVLKGGCGFEVTTFRIDGKYTDSRHPESVEFTRSLEEDLKRRDFTINAFAYCPEKGVIDLFSGMEDLNNSLIRCVGEPEKRFSEDALRIMRAVRFSAQLSFEIEEDTKKAIEMFAPRLKDISMERIRVEFEKTILSDNPAHAVMYGEFGLAPYIVPGVYEKCFGKEEALFMENIRGFNREDTKYLRLAAFLSKLSCEECRKTLKKFTYDSRTRDIVSDIIRFKDEIVTEDRPAVKSAMGRMGAETFRLVQEFCRIREETAKRPSEHYVNLLEICTDVLTVGEPYLISQLAINGSDLIKAGIPEGAEIGKALKRILEKVIKEPELNDKKELMKEISLWDRR